MAFISGELSPVQTSKNFELIDITESFENTKTSFNTDKISFYNIYVEEDKQVLGFRIENFERIIFCSIPPNAKIDQVLKAVSLVKSELSEFEDISPTELYSVISNLVDNKEFFSNNFKGTKYENRVQREIDRRKSMLDYLLKPTGHI